MAPRTRRHRKRLFAAITIAGILLFQEILFHALFPIPEIVGFNRLNYSFLANANSSAAPLANASYYWISDPDGVAFTHHLNLYGFRDRQWRVRRRSCLESRIFVIGDSFVEGFMVEADATIPRVMEREVTAAGVRTEVMNLGIGGTQTPSYFRLIRDAVPLFRPDTIILILFANDLPAPPFDPS